MAPAKKTALSKEIIKDKLRERKKLSKQNLKVKRARLVVKNLPFAATEDNLKEHFERYGEVSNVELLKKSDGKLVGCGFIQFKLVQKAAKAKHHTNNKPFLGRDIIVDFAKAKDKYNKEIKKENNVLDTGIKSEEPVIPKDTKEVIEIKDEEMVSDSEKTSEKDLEEENSEINDESDEDINKEKERKPHVVSNDVSEGRTIFVKNIPFQATNEDFRECMGQFGPVFYALICMDRLTEHSKGTGFAKFVNKEDAEKALNAGTELKLLGNILDCHPALNRNDVHQKLIHEKEQKNKPKDSRNLYLVKEGVILAGTKAAEGVSASDMAKRLQIEQYKTQMLRNLNMFVSRERLVIHNLPPSWDDTKLRVLCQKFAGPGAVIKETRIMRDFKNVDANGIGQSKEYGFVAFTRHEDALTLLRSLNNNPNIFSASRRPIITFSIENKAMIKAKQKRLDKSQLKNPKSKNYNPNAVKNYENNFKQTSRNRKFEDDIGKEFAGVTAKEGVKQKMRSRYKLGMQAKIHHETLKKEKKKKKFAKKTLEEKKREFIKQPKQKIVNKKNKDMDNFSKLVNEYKKKIINAPTPKKDKWYK